MRANPVPGRLGLRTEVLLSLGLLTATAITLVTSSSLVLNEGLAVRERRSSLLQTTLVLERGLSLAIAAPGGEERVREAARGLSREAAVASLLVVDRSGKVLASSREEEIGTFSRDPWIARALAAGRLVTPEEDGGAKAPSSPGVWTYSAPLPGEKGAFAVGYAVSDLTSSLRLQRRLVLLLALLDTAIIIFFGNWLIGKVAVRPVEGISRASRALAAGDLGSRAEVTGSRELAALSEAFNEMASTIQDSHRRQEEQMEALAAANRELAAAREEVLRSEKLASVGRLAAGVAHEIGNPLSAVLGYTGLLLRENPAGETAEYLSHIEGETVRIKRIIGDLLEFSRPGEAAAEELDANELVQDALDLVLPQGAMRGVELAVEKGRDLPRVRGNRHQLQQALINLFLNAAQAMEGNGILHVTTGLHRLSAEEAEGGRRRVSDAPGTDYTGFRRREIPGIRVLRPGEEVVRITVADTGCGIPQELLGRIFDPFFSTKPTGEGTGLGLSIAFGIVAAHKGRLTVRSEPGRGAEFSIDLPASDAPDPAAEAR